MLCSRLIPNLDQKEFKFLLTGGVALGEPEEHPPAEWVSMKMWSEMHRAADLPGFKGFITHFKEHIAIYK